MLPSSVLALLFLFFISRFSFVLVKKLPLRLCGCSESLPSSPFPLLLYVASSPKLSSFLAFFLSFIPSTPLASFSPLSPPVYFSYPSELQSLFSSLSLSPMHIFTQFSPLLSLFHLCCPLISRLSVKFIGFINVLELFNSGVTEDGMKQISE